MYNPSKWDLSLIESSRFWLKALISEAVTPSNASSKKTTKKFRVRIPVETLLRACLDVLYFNKTVTKVQMTVKTNSNQILEVTCSARGRLRGRITKDVADIWVTGTPEEIKHWNRFFTDFAQVPDFSLKEYVSWLKGS